MRDTALIEFRDVGLALGGATVFAGLEFAVRSGEFLCVLGPSGCGKSTALRVIADLLAVDSGSVRVDGTAPGARWRDIAFVFQSPRLLPWRSALDNVTLGMELRFDAADPAAMRAKALGLLELVGLAADAGKYPRMLSGGERQRVALARALAVDPKIVLMDEPFSALDPNTRRRLREELIRIWEQTGKTIVFVTHDVDEALVLADRVVLLSAKPTRVLETLEVTARRPRDPSSNPELAALRARLHELFRALEPADSEPEEVAP
jgi:NitT/TauT family transport system ATP-binding protein